MILLCAGAGAVAYHELVPLLRGSACEARTSAGTVRISTDQAAGAATIAAVGLRKDMPRRGVTIALAAAWQESKLHNLSYGDRDSVGLFQQRPSQGWGTRKQLRDPVYASSRFYDALRHVPDYPSLSIAEAAQRVQRSADGTAYIRHKEEARVLSKALTGTEPTALHCWYPDDGDVGAAKAPEVRRELARVFGPQHIRVGTGGLTVTPGGPRRGWAVATWAVAHAKRLGLSGVAYQGRRWNAPEGFTGWQPADDAHHRVRISLRPR